MSDLNIPTATAVLIRGGVIAYPTEGVWGLGCIPFDGEAVHRLLAIKRRAVDKGLILVGAEAAQFDAVADWSALDAAARERVLDSWPGPQTWIVPAAPRRARLDHRWARHVWRCARARTRTVAALCRRLGGPIVSTSANLSGEPAVRDRDALSPALLALVDGVCAGDTGGLGGPTPIRDARTGLPLRA